MIDQEEQFLIKAAGAVQYLIELLIHEGILTPSG